jgi:hypothetical protein
MRLSRSTVFEIADRLERSKKILQRTYQQIARAIEGMEGLRPIAKDVRGRPDRRF